MVVSSFSERISHFLHQRLLLLVVAAYVLATISPEAGDWLRSVPVSVGPSFDLRIPQMLLALLLFNAGLASDVRELAVVARRPQLVVAGVVASTFVPVAMVAALAGMSSWWHDAEEARSVMIGLGLVAAMPIAGSSTAWSQNAGGSPALSLGLVVASTVLSPLTTPMALGMVLPLAGMESSGGSGGSSTLLLCSVVLPSMLGMAIRFGRGGELSTASKHRLKSANSIVLLVLCYVNAAGAMPTVAARPDWDFLVVVIALSLLLCISGFATGWAVGRMVKAASPQRRSLEFALGMSNNGTGLVIAGSTFTASPDAVLPVLVYNLVQHVVASVVDRRLKRPLFNRSEHVDPPGDCQALHEAHFILSAAPDADTDEMGKFCSRRPAGAKE